MKYLLIISLVLLGSLVLVGGVLAMSSANYRLDWFTPMTGSGGTTGSTNYGVTFTVGQSVTGGSFGTAYTGCLGYWCTESSGTAVCRVYLPTTMREFTP